MMPPRPPSPQAKGGRGGWSVGDDRKPGMNAGPNTREVATETCAQPPTDRRKISTRSYVAGGGVVGIMGEAIGLSGDQDENTKGKEYVERTRARTAIRVRRASFEVAPFCRMGTPARLFGCLRRRAGVPILHKTRQIHVCATSKCASEWVEPKRTHSLAHRVL